MDYNLSAQVGNSYSRQVSEGFGSSSRDFPSEAWKNANEKPANLPQSRDHELLSKTFAEEINNRNMSDIKNLRNQALDVNYKMRDVRTSYSIPSNAQDSDLLRCIQSYSLDPIRNYPSKSGEHTMHGFPEPSYHQSRLDLQHRGHSPALINQQLTSFKPSITDMMFLPRVHPFQQCQMPKRPGLPYGYDHPKVYTQESHGPFIDQPVLPNNYSPAVIPGQTSSVVNALPGSHLDTDIAPKGLPNATLLPYNSMYPSGMDKYSHYMGKYPVYNSYCNSKSPQEKVSASSSHAKSSKLKELSVIDLTNSSSPDLPNNSLEKSSLHTQSIPPPLIAGYNNHHKERLTDLHSWNQSSSYSAKNLVSSTMQNNSQWPPYSVPVAPSYTISKHSYAPNFSDPAYGLYEIPHLDSRSHHPKSHTEPLMSKLNPQWPIKYLTPPPQPLSTFESQKKTESPLKSKTLPQPTSEISFNYPEGNKMESICSAIKHTPRQDLSSYYGQNIQNLLHKDDSKLSPFENHILDTAARERPPKSKLRTNHIEPALIKRRNEKFDPSNSPFPKNNPKPTPTRISNCGMELPRNSVIKSTPKLIDPHPSAPQIDRSSPKPSKLQNVNSCKPKSTDSELQGLDSAKMTKQKGEANLALFEKDGGSNYKKDQPKISPINSSKSDVKSASEAVGSLIKEDGSMKSPPRKRKLSVFNDEEQPKKTKLSATDAVQDEASAVEDEKQDSSSQKVSSRRQRKSGDMEEYYYDWFSDNESDNDDSSDEDYSCPLVPTKSKIVTKGSSKIRTRRTASIRSEEGIMDIEREKDEPTTEPAKDEKPVTDMQEKSSTERPSSKKESKKTKMREKMSSLDAVEDDVDKCKKVEDKVEECKLIEKELSVMPELDSSATDSQCDESKPVDKSPDKKKEENDKTEHSATDANKSKDTEIPRVKRKYNKKNKEKDGAICKKQKKTKIPEDCKSHKKKRKNKKSSKFVFDGSDNELNDNKHSLATKSQSNSKIPPGISPALAEIYMNGPNEGAKKQKKSNGLSPEKQEKTKKSPKRKHSRDVSANNIKPSLTVECTLTSPSASSIVDQCKEPELSCSSAMPKSTSELSPKDLPKTLSQTPAPSTATCVKMRKKPGPKPGSKRHSQDKQGAVNEKDVPKKVKKARKPKGDGLPRFGMRKRGWSKNKHKKAKLLKTKQQVSSSSKLGEPSRHTKEPTKRGLVFTHSKPDCNKTKHLHNNFISIPNINFKMQKDGSRAKQKVSDANEIGEELRNQEYNFKTDLSLYNAKTEPCSSSACLIEGSVGESSSPPDCSPEIPTLQIQDSPLPLNFKKLWCNNAIGETQLHKAARHGYMDNMLYYLERGSSVNQSDNAGYTALHEACVHNHLEAAMLLLQFGADVNKNAVDGTRPFHDAVEYDHLEMARLMLASGADPMLNKFSGRSVINMIRSEKMGKFIQAYLKQLKENSEEMMEDEKLQWQLPCSQIFEKVIPHSYNVLDDAPPKEKFQEMYEFEMYEELPLVTYLFQPEEDSERSNFCLLDDYLKATQHSGQNNGKKIRIHTISRKRFMEQLCQSQIYQTAVSKLPMVGPDDSIIELVAVDESVSKSVGAEIVFIPAETPLKPSVSARSTCSSNNLVRVAPDQAILKSKEESCNGNCNPSKTPCECIPLQKEVLLTLNNMITRTEELLDNVCKQDKTKGNNTVVCENGEVKLNHVTDHCDISNDDQKDYGLDFNDHSPSIAKVPTLREISALAHKSQKAEMPEKVLKIVQQNGHTELDDDNIRLHPEEFKGKTNGIVNSFTARVTQ